MLWQRGRLIHHDRDAYGVLEVIDDHSTRSLYFGTTARQSSMQLDDPVRLALSYTRCMLAALLFVPEPRNILIIGLGGGSLVRFLLHHYPHCRITAVEYRAAVADIARRFFALPQEDARLHVVITDGAAFLRTPAAAPYDLILIDAFDADGIHSQVTQVEFFRHCRDRLDPAGVTVINLWDTERRASRRQLRDFQLGFGSRPLQLPVAARNNLIAFGIPALRNLPDRSALQDRITELQRRCGLDFVQYHHLLWRHNTSWIQRLSQTLASAPR